MSTADRPIAGGDRYVSVCGRVEIFDTDASGLLFYGAPTRWFCTAETDFVERYHLGEDVGQAMGDGGPFAPTRSVQIELLRPMQFLDEFDHHLWISAVGRSSYAISHAVCVGGEVCVRGIVRRVRVRRLDSGEMTPVPVTAHMRSLVLEEPPA